MHFLAKSEINISLEHTHTTYFCASVLVIAMVRDIMFSGCPSLHTSHFTDFFILILKDSLIFVYIYCCS